MATKTKKPTHWNRRYLRRMDGGDAFIPDVARSYAMLTDDDAEAFAEEFIVTATSAEDVGEDARDEVVEDELVAFNVLPNSDEFVDSFVIEREHGHVAPFSILVMPNPAKPTSKKSKGKAREVGRT